MLAWIYSSAVSIAEHMVRRPLARLHYHEIRVCRGFKMIRSRISQWGTQDFADVSAHFVLCVCVRVKYIALSVGRAWVRKYLETRLDP